MELDLNVLRPQERASLQLRLLYEQEGFRKYHMGRFEEYGLYQENRRFLSSEQVITFTDLDGRLLAHGALRIFFDRDECLEQRREHFAVALVEHLAE